MLEVVIGGRLDTLFLLNTFSATEVEVEVLNQDRIQPNTQGSVCASHHGRNDSVMKYKTCVRRGGGSLHMRLPSISSKIAVESSMLKSESSNFKLQCQKIFNPSIFVSKSFLQ